MTSPSPTPPDHTDLSELEGELWEVFEYNLGRSRYDKRDIETMAEVLALFKQYAQHLYTRQDVKAICEEALMQNSPDICECGHRWKNGYCSYCLGEAYSLKHEEHCVVNGKEAPHAEYLAKQRQSIDSIIDKWGK